MKGKWKLIVACAVFSLTVSATDYGAREEVRSFIDELVHEHGFARADLLDVLGRAERQDRIIELISKPAEKAKPWHEYREIFVTPKRTAGGLTFWEDNEQVLAKAESDYGVPAHIIVSIIGVETYYGRIAGTFRVVDALSTLAFDYPPRSAFFRRELGQFLLLAREEKMDPLALKGSYAGAMGYGQFIPSSYRQYAVDFDGDGLRDVWSNTSDAVGSVANYFSRHGWRGDGPIAVPVRLDDAGADTLANTGLKPAHTVAELRRLGVAVSNIDGGRDAALFRMEGKGGPEYWLGLHDFYVITRYNHSSMYALAVLQLSEEIRRARANVVAQSH